jgi:hypothetical protein
MRDDAERLIREAFAGVEQPQGLALAPHICPECDDLRTRLGPYNFSSVPDDVLDYLSDSLPILGAKGLLHYLPAYLLRATRVPPFRGLDFLLFHLAPSEHDLAERSEYWHERLSVFSEQQRAAVRAFLEWFATTSDAVEYLDELRRAREVWGGAA